MPLSNGRPADVQVNICMHFEGWTLVLGVVPSEQCGAVSHSMFPGASNRSLLTKICSAI